MTLKLTIAGGPYDRTAALRDGRVRPEGVEVSWLPLRPDEIFWRMMRHREFDVSELSLSGYVVRRGRGLEDLVAIPVFLSRSFRHNIVYVNAASGIDKPEDLIGRTVGVPEYQMTAAVWARGLLEDDYGVRPQDIQWHEGGLERWGRRPFEPVRPEGVTIVPTAQGKTLARMVADGELDALISPRLPSTFDEHGKGAVRRLFPNPYAMAREYYERTRIFPIMHTVAIKQELVDRHPWLPKTLLKAFEEAKALAFDDLRDTSAQRLTLPFLHEHVDETAALMGDDFWPYGLEANRHNLETFLRYAHHQGLIGRPMQPDDLFPQSTWHNQPT